MSMQRVRTLASASPIAFAFAVTLAFILLVVVSAIFAGRWPAESAAWYLAAMVGRVVSIALLLALTARLGWLRPAGFTRAGTRSSWLLLLAPLVYAVAASAYVATGNFDFRADDGVLTVAALLFISAAAFMEEIAFRGLIQHGFVRSRGNAGAGLLASVLLSSSFFALMHIVNVLGGEPLPEVLLQCVVAFFLGVFLGALVVSGMSIYPAVFFHAVLNIGGYLNLTSNAAEGTVQSWFMLAVVMGPVAIVGLALLRAVPRAAAARDPAREAER